MLTPSEASPIVGVPVVQLLRWAVLGQGPKNSGTKHKPLYAEEDLERWKESLRGRIFTTGTDPYDWTVLNITLNA